MYNYKESRTILMEKSLSADLANFWICCSPRHFEQMIQLAQLDLMSRFRATNPGKSKFNM